MVQMTKHEIHCDHPGCTNIYSSYNHPSVMEENSMEDGWDNCDECNIDLCPEHRHLIDKHDCKAIVNHHLNYNVIEGIQTCGEGCKVCGGSLV